MTLVSSLCSSISCSNSVSFMTATVPADYLQYGISRLQSRSPIYHNTRARQCITIALVLTTTETDIQSQVQYIHVPSPSFCLHYTTQLLHSILAMVTTTRGSSSSTNLNSSSYSESSTASTVHLVQALTLTHSMAAQNFRQQTVQSRHHDSPQNDPKTITQTGWSSIYKNPPHYPLPVQNSLPT